MNICKYNSNNVLQFTIHNVIINKKGGIPMATKSANVMARVEPEIKEQAEEILTELGLPVSTVINALYRQIIMRNGIPFSLNVPKGFVSRDSMSNAEFDNIMQIGLDQAESGEVIDIDTAFANLRNDLGL